MLHLDFLDVSTTMRPMRLPRFVTAGKGRWWFPPRLRTDGSGERKATWLELFFDLLFIVLLRQLSHVLSDDLSWRGLAQFSFLYLPVWWMWIGCTYYNDRFDNDDVSHRFAAFLQMLPVAAMAVFIQDAFHGASHEFAFAYLCSRVLLIALWMRGGYHNPVTRPLTNRYALGFGTSVLLWGASLFFDGPAQIALWTLGLVCDFLTPLFTISVQRTLPSLSRSHLPERFGLFMMIVLGESVISVVQGLAGIDRGATEMFNGLLGFALVFGFWWIYFDDVASRHKLPPFPWSMAWTYGHLPLALSLTALGIGILLLPSMTDEVLDPRIRWLLAGSSAAALLSVALIEWALHRLPSDHDHDHDHGWRHLHLGGAAAAVFAGIAGAYLPASAFLLLLLAIILFQALHGLSERYRCGEC